MTELNENSTHVTGFTEGTGKKSHALFRKIFCDGLVAQVIGYIFAVLSGFTFSLDVLLVKRNPYFNDDILEVVIWILVTNTCFSVIIMFIIEKRLCCLATGLILPW